MICLAVKCEKADFSIMLNYDKYDAIMVCCNQALAKCLEL